MWLQIRPIQRVIELINPILRGWVNYFRIGHSSKCFSFIRNWVEKKIRHHLARASKRHGFGWKRWSRRWFYEELGLFDDYQVRYQWTMVESRSDMIGLINLDVKSAGKRSAGNPHAAFDVAGVGNGTSLGYRASSRPYPVILIGWKVQHKSHTERR